MILVKDKSERMIQIANGEVVRRIHAFVSRNYIADERVSSYLKKKKRTGL